MTTSCAAAASVCVVAIVTSVAEGGPHPPPLKLKYNNNITTRSFRKLKVFRAIKLI